MVEPQPENFSDAADLPVNGTGPAQKNNGVEARIAEVAPPAVVQHDGGATPLNFQQSLRPILQGIEAVARAQYEQVDVLDRVEKVMMHQTTVPKMLSETKQALEARNLVNRAMFEALHAELKTYKDAFLLEAVLKPVIRDLISLYDDISEIHRQLTLVLTTHEQRGNLAGSTLVLFENVAAPTNQLEHNRDAILEVLERLDVSLLPPSVGKLDKRTQRAVSIEYTENPEHDQDIVKVVKRGFLWKDRVIRPEEVVMKKWKEGNLSAPGKTPGQP